MARDWDLARLQRYLDLQVEEGLQLEYKSGEALAKGHGRAREVAKDVSAMANAAGGVIIYGIGEHPELRHRPAEFSPVDRRECSKETLEQIISSNIQPRLSGVKIYPIPLPSDPNHVAYVTAVAQSDTVHQVIGSMRYYKRFNFESVPMEDYEVRDVLNRGTHPILEPRIGHMTFTQPELPDTLGMDEPGPAVWVWDVPIFIKNTALVVGKDSALTAEFLDLRPTNIVTPIRFQIKTQPVPTHHLMYISSFDEAIHRGLNKYFGTLQVTIREPQSLLLKLQVFSNGMRAKWWQVKLNFGATSATVQVLDEGYLY